MAKKKMTLEEKLEEALIKDGTYEVPKNWIWSKIKFIGNVKGGKRLPKGKSLLDTKTDYPYIRVADFDNGTINSDKIKYLDEESYNQIKNYTISSKDIYVSIAGSIGKVGLIPQILNGANLTENAAKISDIVLVSNKYLYFLLSSEMYQREMNEAAIATTQSKLALYKIGDLVIPIPPLKEQQRIVDKIECLFEKLDKAKELIEEARDDFEKRKSAILEKAFRGELTKEWRVENNFKLDEWKEKLLSETNIQIIDGDRGKNYPKKDEFETEGYCLFLNAKNVTKEGFRFNELNFITKEKDELLRKGKLERFDIVLTTRGTIGNIAYYDENIAYKNIRINSGMVIYRGGNEFYKPFLCRMYQSRYIIDQIDKMKTGTAQPQLPIKIMKNLRIIVPPIEEQKEIVRILDKLLEEESKIEELTALEEQIELIKKSILAKAFRGQLGTNCEDDESSIELLKEILKNE